MSLINNPRGNKISMLIHVIAKENPEGAAALRGIEAVTLTSSDGITAARKNLDLNDRGKRAAITKVLTTARQGLRKHEAEVSRLATKAAATKGEALAKWGGEVDPAAVLEVRALIRESKVADLQIASDLMEAVANNDALYVAAVETAPRKFPLVKPSWIARSEEMRLESSPLKERYDAELSTHTRLTGAVGTATAELAAQAEDQQMTATWLGIVHAEGEA